MQRGRTVLAAIMVALFTVGLVGAPAALAQSQSVDVWMEVQTSHPAYGCYVDASVEVRNGGGAVSGADVGMTLSNDADSTIISTESGVTDGNGIVYLGFDTSNAPSDKTWLEITVNGSYVGGRTIWIGGEGCDGAPSLLDLSGDVPAISDTVSAPAPAVETTTSGGTILPNVVTYVQQRNLSCEYAAVSIATGMLGGWVDEYDMEQLTGLSDNPHWGYRGNITGWWGNTDDYGVYASALVPGLNARGFQAEVFYGAPEDLMTSLDAGRPTIVWLGMWGETSFDAYTSDGTRYQLTPGMHVMTAYGYDESGVYLSDPANGGLVYYDWGTFNGMWQVMDGMALGVSW
jgi:uncharacterized protein YvpB